MKEIPLSDRIVYRDGFLYQLSEDYIHQLGGNLDNIPVGVLTEWLCLTQAGVLTIKQGYAWNGGNFPARDTKNAMRAYLVHDAGYQLTRFGLLSRDIWRPLWDKEFKRVLREDKVSRFRAWYLHRGVRIGGRKAASASGIRPVLYAP